MRDALRRGHFGAELPVSGRQVLMAARYSLVARHRAAPQRAVLRPAFRIREETFDQTLCYLPVENRKPWIDVDQGVGRAKSFPGCGGVAVAIDDPGLLAKRSRCSARYSLWGTASPPSLNCSLSMTQSGSFVISANCRAKIDFPAPAFPNTATRFMARCNTTPKSARLRAALSQRGYKASAWITSCRRCPCRRSGC